MGSLIQAGMSMITGAFSPRASSLTKNTGALESIAKGLDAPMLGSTAQMNQLVATTGKSMGTLTKTMASDIKVGKPLSAEARTQMNEGIKTAKDIQEDLKTRQGYMKAVAATAVEANKTAQVGVESLSKVTVSQAKYVEATAGLLGTTAEATTSAKGRVQRLTGRSLRALAGV